MSTIPPEFLSFIEESLKQVEISQIHPVLGSSIEYFVKSRGKHLRPLICALSTELIGGSYKDTKNAILALELIHSASLVHDDIIDEDYERRGSPAVHSKFGTKTAVLTGDAMFTLGLHYAMRTYDLKIIKILNTTTQKMLQGIALQSYNRGRRLTEQEYLQINYLKSGSLFEAAAEIGGMIAQGSPSEIKRLSLFGRYYGNAYQILDDICDAVIVEEKNGSDLKRGDLSLPLIYALGSSKISLEELDKLVRIYRGENNENYNQIFDIYEKTGAIERSSAKMRKYAEKAREILNGFNNSKASLALHSMLDLYDKRDIMTTVELSLFNSPK